MKRVDVAGRGDDGAVPLRLLLADGALPVVRDGPRGDALEADHGHALDDACAQQRKLSEGGGGEAGRGRGGAGPGRRDRGGGEGLVEEPPAWTGAGARASLRSRQLRLPGARASLRSRQPTGQPV